MDIPQLQIFSFIITKEEKEIMQGTFITKDGYDYYQGLIEELGKTEEVEIIKDGEKDGNTYTFYKVESDAGMEYDCLMNVGNQQQEYCLEVRYRKRKLQNALMH